MCMDSMLKHINCAAFTGNTFTTQSAKYQEMVMSEKLRKSNLSHIDFAHFVEQKQKPLTERHFLCLAHAKGFKHMGKYDWNNDTNLPGYGDAYDDSWDEKPTPECLQSKREYEEEARQWARDYE